MMQCVDGTAPLSNPRLNLWVLIGSKIGSWGCPSEGGDDLAWMTEAMVADVGYLIVITDFWMIRQLDHLKTPYWLCQP